MAESKAAKLASGWSSKKARNEEADLKGLPKNVQEGILSVEESSHNIAEQVGWAEQLYASAPDDEFSLEPGNHPQTSWAMRYEIVDGEVIQILKEDADEPTQLIHRPDLVLGEDVDPASALAARFHTPLSEEEKGEAQAEAEALAAEQVRDD